jgi:DNA-binding transcriptional MerR regulator
MTERELTVKAITKLTGLNEHTLRAWERRYGAVRPKRLPNGRRLYTEADVERLRKMVQLVERGYTVGRIAAMPDAELSSLLSRNMALAEGEPARGAAQGSRDGGAALALAAIEKALERFDLAGVYDELSRARISLGVRSFTLAVVSPLMARVGRLGVEGRFGIGQEHALSAMVRTQLAALLFQLRRRRGQRTLVVATMEGDLDELGVLIGAVLCAEHGLGVSYLGPSMPPGALGEAVAALGADVLLLGTPPLPAGSLPRTPERYLAQLGETLPQGCELWIFGPVEVELRQARLPAKPRLVRSLNELDQLVQGVGVTSAGGSGHARRSAT